MSAPSSAAASFTGLVDLAAEELGGRALACSDDFFAAMENLLKPGRAVFIPGKYTERGKWMDGWESRRKRGGGHDWCLIALGVPGIVRGLDVDTQHFVGNHPPFASVEGVLAPPGASVDEIARMAFTPLLPESPLRPDAQNLFAALPTGPVSHIRLRIFPDGGVARFRVFGEVASDFTVRAVDEASAPHVADGWVDLAALTNGGLPLACSDAFFGPMHNLLLPGRSIDMSGGWETRRKRAPGHDWIVVRLGARGIPKLVEVDTNHFKGNYPDRCALDGLDAAGLPLTQLVASTAYVPLLAETKLEAHTRHFFPLHGDTPITHVRLHIFPDGGVSRLRVWGERDG